MKMSLSVTNFSWRERSIAENLADLAQLADEGGVNALWVADHVLQVDPYGARPDETEMLEAYTTLGFLAARTSRLRLGTLVSAVTFRPPALLVKAVTTLDELSHGRAMLGIASSESSAGCATRSGVRTTRSRRRSRRGCRQESPRPPSPTGAGASPTSGSTTSPCSPRPDRGTPTRSRCSRRHPISSPDAMHDSHSRWSRCHAARAPRLRHGPRARSNASIILPAECGSSLRTTRRPAPSA